MMVPDLPWWWGLVALLGIPAGYALLAAIYGHFRPRPGARASSRRRRRASRRH